MTEATKKRIDEDIELVLQLTDGNRVNGKFKSNTKLYDIIQQLCPNECIKSNLRVAYVRTEISGDKLAETTLKDLGLMGGRAIFRLRHDPIAKDENEDSGEIHIVS